MIHREGQHGRQLTQGATALLDQLIERLLHRGQVPLTGRHRPVQYTHCHQRCQDIRSGNEGVLADHAQKTRYREPAQLVAPPGQQTPQADDILSGPVGYQRAHAAVLATQIQHHLGIARHTAYLGQVPDEPLVAHEPFDMLGTHQHHLLGIEAEEYFLERRPAGIHHAVLESRPEHSQGNLRQVAVIGHGPELLRITGDRQTGLERLTGAEAVKAILFQPLVVAHDRSLPGSEIHDVDEARRGAVIHPEAGKVEQRGIGQLRRLNVAQGAEDVLHPAGGFPLPTAQHLLDHLALQVLLGAAEVAGNDGKLLEYRIGFDVLLVAVGQRAYHHVATIIGAQLGRHGLEVATIEHVEEEGLDDVVPVVPQRHLGGADLVGKGVEIATTQARTQGTGGLALGHLLLDDGIGVAFEDVVRNAQAIKVGRKHMLGEAGLLLVHVYRYDLEADGRDLLQVQQHVQHGVAVLATGQADHDLVAVLDHVVIGNRFCRQTTQTFLQFVLVHAKAGHGGEPGCTQNRAFYRESTTRKTAEHAEGAGRHPPRSGMSAQVDGTDTQPPEDDRGGHHADKNHQSHRQNGAGKQEAFLLRDAHEDGDTLVQEVGGVADGNCACDHGQPEVRIQGRQSGDEQGGGGVGGEDDAFTDGRVGIIGPRHPVDESTHDRYTCQHRKPGERRHLQCTGLGQLDRFQGAYGPADLSSANVGGYRRNSRQNQYVHQVNRPESHFTGLDASPRLVRVGEQPHNILDHGLTS